MNKAGKISVVLVLTAAVGITVALKQSRLSGSQEQTSATVSEVEASGPGADVPKEQAQDNTQVPPALPRLVDLGAGKCVPCKMMAPILEELKTDYAGIFKVDFIDVWKNPDKAGPYGIKLIPTQIFYDASGKELFRHEGFFSKADILTKWKELGIDTERKQE
ncbi:MAG: thioredoxin family protein [Planctomycetota bacterium]|jgi:thioredoxin 1